MSDEDIWNLYDNASNSNVRGELNALYNTSPEYRSIGDKFNSLNKGKFTKYLSGGANNLKSDNLPGHIMYWGSDGNGNTISGTDTSAFEVGSIYRADGKGLGGLVSNSSGGTKMSDSFSTLDSVKANDQGWFSSLLDGKGIDGVSNGGLIKNADGTFTLGGNFSNTTLNEVDLTQAQRDSLIDGTADAATDKGTDWGMDGWGGVGLGVGQLGLGVLSYFDGKENNDQVIKGMQQTYAFNEENAANSRAASKKVRDAIGRTAAKMATPGGLVSRASADYQKPTAGSL